MKTILQKNLLRDGYYYSGYIHQHYCVVSDTQQKIIGMWDSTANCFWFWEYENNKKIKSKLSCLQDIDNEIQAGFLPIDEVIPREEFVIE